MSGELKDKVGLVTGASSGIGRATALAMAAAGASVLVAARREAELAALVSEIEANGGRALAVPTDVTDEAAVQVMVEACVSEYGRIDFAFNNAGIEGSSQPTSAYSVEEFQAVLNVNTVGTFSCMKYELLQMQSQGHGAIVNDASVAGLRGMFRQSAYTTSKHAVIGITRALAHELARHKINVNAYCPGVVDTPMWDKIDGEVAPLIGLRPGEVKERAVDMIPLGRIEVPEDVANLVAFLASSDSDYMTGQAINITGGGTTH